MVNTIDVFSQSIKIESTKKIVNMKMAQNVQFGKDKNEILFLNTDHIVNSIYNIDSNKKISADFYTIDKRKKINDSLQIVVMDKKMILRNQKSDTYICPISNCYYIWASLSPDLSKILFTAAGKGTYVSDFKGNIKHSLGTINAPVWINNNWIAAMIDQDDGKQIVASDIVIVHIPTLKNYVVTNNIDAIAMYPKIARSKDRLLFNTPEGDVYIIDFCIEK